jgi:hypothetical protein
MTASWRKSANTASETTGSTVGLGFARSFSAVTPEGAPHGVDAEAPSEWKRDREKREQVHDHVAAVLDEDVSCVETRNRDEREHLHQLGRDAERVCDANGEHDRHHDRHLAHGREGVKQREELVPHRTEQREVVREEAVVRVVLARLPPPSAYVQTEQRAEQDAERAEPADVRREVAGLEQVVHGLQGGPLFAFRIHHQFGAAL